MILALARACHLEPTLAVTGVAGLLALAVGHPPGSAGLVTATILASQLAVGWANDALDAERDAAVGRTDKPIVTGQIGRRPVAVAAGLAAVSMLLLAIAFGPAAAAVIGLGLVSALAYNWPLKRTLFSPLPYAVSFATLPAFVVLALPATPPWWLVTAGALLGAGAHFANVLPDLADDAVTGIHGAPHRLGAVGCAAAAAGLLLAATVVLVFGRPGTPPWWATAGLLIAGSALLTGWYVDRRLAGRRRSAGLFRAFMVVALINVGLLLTGGVG